MYIEREAVVKYIRSREGNFIDDMGKGWSNGMDAAASMCEKFPAADVVEVVRCKECKEWGVKKAAHQQDKFGFCACNLMETHEDFFCAYGERRTNNV